MMALFVTWFEKSFRANRLRSPAITEILDLYTQLIQYEIK